MTSWDSTEPVKQPSTLNEHIMPDEVYEIVDLVQVEGSHYIFTYLDNDNQIRTLRTGVNPKEEFLHEQDGLLAYHVSSKIFRFSIIEKATNRRRLIGFKGWSHSDLADKLRTGSRRSNPIRHWRTIYGAAFC